MERSCCSLQRNESPTYPVGRRFVTPEAIGFANRLMHKAKGYQRFLCDVIDSDGDVEKLRHVVIQNRSLIFDDLDFIAFAQLRIQESESSDDSEGAHHWRWLVEFIINTICFYD